MPVITVQLLEGRSEAQKRDLAESLTREFVRACGGRPESVYVIIEESRKQNWAVGGRLLSDPIPDLN